ncbi:MAG TPA: hypothetical protein VHW23_44140, partial [Kofleriaceae bacterium]|nr:hypothetical protein [Kofleriaceae bacterium]
TLDEMKYEPKVDYRRKRGLVEEINRAIQAVEEDINAANALGRRRFVEPGAVEYGPSRIESPDDGPAPPPARPDAKQPAPIRPAPKAPPAAEPRSQLDSPAAPSASPAADGKQSRVIPKAKPGQRAVSPADLAAEGLPHTGAKKSGHKPETKLASQHGDAKAKQPARPAPPADRAADEPSRLKSRARMLRDLSSPPASPPASAPASAQKGAN